MSSAIRRASRCFQPAQVDGDTPLWHLIPIESLYKLDTFLRGGLWFSRLDKFGPLKGTKEGKVPKLNLGLLEKMPEDMIEWVEKQYRLAVLRSYATCWSKGGTHPSAEMWNTKFGGYGKGLAISTKAEAVREAISPFTNPSGNGPIYFGAVEYIDHGKDLIQQENTLAAAFAIQLRYRDENEARVLIHSYGANAVAHLVGRQGPLGPLVSHETPDQSKSGEREFTGGQDNGEAIVIGIDPNRFIQEIVLGPSLDAIECSKIVERIHSHGLASKVRSPIDVTSQ